MEDGLSWEVRVWSTGGSLPRCGDATNLSMFWQPAPGTELGGYVISSQIGKGGMASVYLADQTALGRKVALKILSPELAEDEEFRERFQLKESRLAAALERTQYRPGLRRGRGA